MLTPFVMKYNELINFEPINEWNREHIWKYGCLKNPNELLENALGEKFDPSYFTNYLEEKYSLIYNLK